MAMHSVSVTELKAHLSRYLRKVKAGSIVQVTERGRPIARLAPVDMAGSSDDVRGRLVRDGTLVPGSGDVSWLLASPPLELDDVDLVGAIVEDREDPV